ncbi:hypothetical protein ACHAXT_008967 [Thalassiosira profunda]
MSFKHKFLAYVALFDGTPKIFADVEPLFDAIYDDEYLQIDGTTLDKSQMRTIHKNCLSIGTRATLISFEPFASTNSITYKVRVVNERVDFVIHMVGTVERGKLIRNKALYFSPAPLLQAKSTLNMYEVERKFQALLDVFDGTAKTGSELDAPFDDLIHQNFVNSMGLCKEEVRQQWKLFLSVATKAEMLSFSPFDGSHFSVEIGYSYQNGIQWKNTYHGTVDSSSLKLVKLSTRRMCRRQGGDCTKDKRPRGLLESTWILDDESEDVGSDLAKAVMPKLEGASERVVGAARIMLKLVTTPAASAKVHPCR